MLRIITLFLACLLSSLTFNSLSLAHQCPHGPHDRPQSDRHTEKWHTGLWMGRGHEDLTRFAVEAANEIIRQQGPHAFLYPEVPYGDAGPTSENPLIQGNHRTDFADETMVNRYKHIRSQDGTFGNDTLLQHLHFLRNYHPEGLWVESMNETCHRARSTMVENIHLIFGLMDKSHDNHLFYYWIGHVSHMVQDAFTTAHVRRSPDHKEIREICTYGKRFPSICFHPLLSMRDRIWKWSWGCLMGGNRDYDCLKEEAKAAVQATIGLLLTVHDLGVIHRQWKRQKRFSQSSWKALVNHKMEDYFTQKESPYSGFFICPPKE